MYIIKGFASIPTLFNNTPNATNPVGELSPSSLTFSRDIGTFVYSEPNEVEFKTFFCKIDGQSTRAPVPQAYGEWVSMVLNILYDRVKIGATVSPIVIKDFIHDEFSTITNFELGPIISAGNFSVPEWVSWEENNLAMNYAVKVWFSDPAFAGQFDEYEIEIIPPITPVDSFFNNFPVVQSLINNTTSATLISSIKTASNNIPYTTLETLVYDWVNPSSISQTIPTEWTAVVYGNAGLSLDALKEKVIEYILANSTRSEVEWKTIFPAIFISTEFIITPHWDRYSVPNQTLQQGSYSSVLTPQQITDHALISRGSYTENYVRTNVQGSFSTYRTLAFSIVGSVENINGIRTLSAKFPDYMPVATTSGDFARMFINTQRWATLLNNLLVVADTATAYSSLPIGMSRIYRNNIMFIAASQDGVLYLVMAKAYYS